MSKEPDNKKEENSIFRLDRREFIMAGLTLTAAAAFPDLTEDGRST